MHTMKNPSILILSVLLTAILSTATSFFLLKNHYQTEIATTQEFIPKPTFTSYPTAPVNVRPSIIPNEDFVETSKRVTNSVVNITAYQGQYRASSGSGVIISSNGYIATNYHVVEGATEFTVTLANRQEISAKIIGTDPTTDLALLKVNGNNYTPVRSGNSDNVEVGQWVLAVGNPFNLDSTVTAGIVSAKGRNIDIIENAYGIESFIQTDAVVNPGNSGGALVNSRGELIGINTAILSETGAYAGYSFAIPSNLAMKVIMDLKDFGEVKRALLGVSIQDLDTGAAERLGLSSLEGVYISRVNSGSSAAAAGLREGDVIIAVNEVSTASTPELQEQIARFRPGDLVSLSYIRRGRKYIKEGVRLRGIEPSYGGR